MHTASYADTGTAHTGATTMAGYTSSSMEKSTDYDDEEEEGQLVFPDYEASQAYLSLGLTPLSQLSPDAHTSGDFGFFPSMPPPVAPSTSSIFSPSSSSSTLAMDNPFSLHSSSGGQSNGGIIDSSMMPDAYPDRRSRRSKYDTNPLSQGFPLKLEPVIEQNSPVNGSQFSGKQNAFSGSDESSKGSPSLSMEPNHFMFPSAVATPEFSRLSQGRTALRKRKDGSSRENLNAVSPRKANLQGSYGSLGVSRNKNMPRSSPSQEAVRKRQLIKEAEAARQKEELRKKREQEESERQRLQDQRMAHTTRQYHHSRGGSDPSYPSGVSRLNSHELTNGHGDMNTVFGEAARFEAIQMMKRPSSRSRQASSNGSIVSSSQSVEESSPHKWTPHHSRHSSLDEGSHRPDRSESTRLYTTYEHM